jgi:hypothetical protein
MTKSGPSNFRVENVTPILYVKDMSQSLTYSVSKMLTGETTTSQVSIVTTPGFTYAKADKDYQVRGFGLGLMETSLRCIKASKQKE